VCRGCQALAQAEDELNALEGLVLLVQERAKAEPYWRQIWEAYQHATA
jgi:hypothetical protein